MSVSDMFSLTPRAQLTVHSTDEGHVIATYYPLLLVCFKRAPRVQEIHLLEEVAAVALRESVRGGLLYVVAREDFGGGVEPRLRKMFEDMILSATIREPTESAVVILTQGFGGAVARGVIAGLLLLSRKRARLRVFSSTDEACDWLSDCHRLDRGKLKAAYREASEHLFDTKASPA